MDQLANAILLVANALWFKGTWSKRFDPAQTVDAEFTRGDGVRVSCRRMTQSGSFECAQNRLLQALRLPYGDGRIALYIFLPSPGVSCRQTLGLLKAWESWRIHFHRQPGEIGLPRFRAEWEETLNQVLVSLGMDVAFESGADFSGIGAGPLMISEVRHKVFLEVDEEGSEAAATTVSMSRSYVEPFQMIVDRPFACAIRDDATGSLLLVGWVAEPAAGR